MRSSILAAAALAACCSEVQAGTCENLRALTIPDTAIASAVPVHAGPFSPGEPQRAGAPAFPAFCRVIAVARPVADSEIRLEVWLPAAETWNGKLLGIGNGGYAGALSYSETETALRQGYAVAGSDTGHSGGDLKFGMGHPEKIADWAFRAVHVMTDTAKVIVRSYYGRFAAHSYFSGCSTGGQQALTEAQRFPEDYDGIVAGAPGANRVRLNVGFLWSWLAVHKDGAEVLPASKLPVINQAAVSDCDALDGVKDGFIGDSRACKFDPGALLCKGADAANCLTAAQVSAVRAVYDGARNPRTGEQLYPGWARGSEASGGARPGGWSGYFARQPEPARLDFWRFWVFHDPDWDFRTFDFDRDIAYADSKLSFLTANDPDLTRFKQRGGRLLMYQGWADRLCLPRTPSNTTRTSNGPWAAWRRRPASSGFSWRRAWAIARADPARAASMRLARWIGGSVKGPRPTGSSHRIPLPQPWTAHDPYALIPR